MGKKHRQWTDDDGEGCYGQILIFKDVPTNDTEHVIFWGVLVVVKWEICTG